MSPVQTCEIQVALLSWSEDPLSRKTRSPDKKKRCILIDGTVRRTPVAEIYINTPYFTGTTNAVCMNNPLYDVIVGNVPGATGLTYTTPRYKKGRYNGRRPWFRNYFKIRNQDFREL